MLCSRGWPRRSAAMDRIPPQILASCTSYVPQSALLQLAAVPKLAMFRRIKRRAQGKICSVLEAGTEPVACITYMRPSRRWIHLKS
eukprot:2373049-Pleurochrysis_carterae.AAC.7